MEVARRSWPIRAPRTPGGRASHAPRSPFPFSRSPGAAAPGAAGDRTIAPRCAAASSRPRGPTPGRRQLWCCGAALRKCPWELPRTVNGFQRIHSSRGRRGRALGGGGGSRTDAAGLWRRLPEETPEGNGAGTLRTCDKRALRPGAPLLFRGRPDRWQGRTARGPRALGAASRARVPPTRCPPSAGPRRHLHDLCPALGASWGHGPGPLNSPGCSVGKKRSRATASKEPCSELPSRLPLRNSPCSRPPSRPRGKASSPRRVLGRAPTSAGQWTRTPAAHRAVP